MQQPAEIQNFPINVAEREYFSEPCHKYLIHYLGNSTKYQVFAGSSGKIEILICRGRKMF